VCRAAKFEEQPHNVPTLSQLANQNDGMLTKAQLIEAEKLVRVAQACRVGRKEGIVCRAVDCLHAW